MEQLPRFDITVIEGAQFYLSLTLEQNAAPLPLTGHTLLAQWRQDYEQESPLICTFSATVPNPDNGELILSLEPAQTIDLVPALHPSRPRTPAGYYDVVITSPSGTTTHLLGGRVVYVQTITRS